jgi:hypothetical protein
MLSTEQINDLYRLYWCERWPVRKIARHLHMGCNTIRKYLNAPAQRAGRRQRSSKLDHSKPPSPYNGGHHSILREYLQKVRPRARPPRAFVRCAGDESGTPGGYKVGRIVSTLKWR